MAGSHSVAGCIRGAGISDLSIRGWAVRGDVTSLGLMECLEQRPDLGGGMERSWR